jgi:hypothetical protein
VDRIERLLCRLTLHDERSVRAALADPDRSEDEIVGVLLAIAPAVGHARPVASAPRLAVALGYDVADSGP